MCKYCRVSNCEKLDSVLLWFMAKAFIFELQYDRTVKTCTCTNSCYHSIHNIYDTHSSLVQLNGAHHWHRIQHAQQIIEVLACVLINLAFVVAMCKQIIMYPSFGPTRPKKSDQRQLSHSTYLATDVQNVPSLLQRQCLIQNFYDSFGCFFCSWSELNFILNNNRKCV